MRRKWWRAVVYFALVVVCAVALAAPIYNRVSPRLFGVPFFIWFQISWVMVAALATGAAHRAAEHHD